MKNKKNLLLVIALLIVAITSIAFLIPNKQGRNYFQEVKYKKLLAAAIQPDNYDKMRISYVRIIERKTGSPSFNNVSDELGHDSSADDNYIRTHDRLTYVVEVGIERNENTTSPIDSFSGGVIKVKARIPKEENKYSKFIFTSDAWGKNVSYNSDRTEMTAAYYIPTEKQPIGGNQQLTFTIYTNGYTGEITNDLTPIFEIWMEGNKPDNNTSLIDSLIIQDEKPLIITGAIEYNMELYKGRVNVPTVINDKRGQMIHFTTYGSTSISKGKTIPANYMNSKIKMDYYYRNVDENGPWINVEDVEPVENRTNGTILYAYGGVGEKTPGFWPNENANNTSYGGWYQFYSKWNGDTWSNNGWVKHDSGVINADFDGATIDYTQTDFYTYTNTLDTRYKQFANAGFELFVPYYEPDGEARYEYKIVFTDNYLKVQDEEGNEFEKNPNTDLTFTYKNYLEGIISYDIYGFTTMSEYDEYETHFLKSDISSQFRSVINAIDGPYLGGFDRLTTWNSSLANLSKNSRTYVDYNTYNTSTPMPSLDAIIIKYGIYKNNPQAGLTTNELVNQTVFEDFDWYDTIEEAEEHGTITAIKTSEPEYRGNDMPSYLWLYLTAIDNPNNIGKIGIVRHKIIFYEDEARTKEFRIGFDNNYSASSWNSTHTGFSYGQPEKIGESFVVTDLFTNISIKTSKSNYNMEEKVNVTINPSIMTPIKDENDQRTFTLSTTIPTELSYIANSANYDPTEIIPNADGTTKIIWRFTDWSITKKLPKITFSLAISPYIDNNKSKTISSNITCGNSTCSRTEEVSVTITNLSGSSLRQNLEKEFVERNENITIDNFIYNISQDILENVKTIEILPKNGDEIGNSFSGEYTIQVLELSNTQKIYYTTNSLDNIGLEEDSVGKKHIQNVDLDNDNRWIELQIGDTIPSNATAIASFIPQIDAVTDISYKLKFLPVNNKYGDKYYFQNIATSENLVNAISSEYKILTVAERRISGKVFEDLNRNDVLNDSDAKEKNYLVELLDEEGNKISDTRTNNEGYYEFKELEKGKYYVRFTNIPDGYELTPKGTNENYSKANPTLVTDLIDHTQNIQNAIQNLGDYNLGIRKKPATLTIKYLDKNNNQPLAEQVEKTVYYTDTYEAKGLTSIPENYSFLENDGDPVSDVVNKDNIVVIYYYDYTPATITARHYIDGTTTKIHEDVIQNKKFTQSYETSKLTIANYDYVRTDGDPESGTISKTNIVVNYYYKLKTGTVITHHYLYDNGETTTKLAPDVSKEWNYTETYTTDVSSQVPQNYEFYKKSDNFTAVMSSPSVEVNYYYRLKDSNITSSITKEGTEEITSKTDAVNYTITYNVSINDYIGDGTIKIVDTLPYKIDVTASDLDGGTYNENNKTITWTEEWKNINSYHEAQSSNHQTITKNIKVVYSDLNPKDRVMTNTTKGTITLSNNTRDSQAQTSTNIKIKGKIKVIYIDIDTKEEIFASVEEEKLVGEEFISSSIEKDGYRLVTKPDSETIEFQEEEQLITYGYEHIKYEVKGVTIGEGGSITGDEDVFWGEDSTEGNIIIKAEPGYVIESVIINGEEISIEPNQEEMVLGQFLQMKENKNIEVSFIKKPIDNPNTNSFVNIAIIIAVLYLCLLTVKTTKRFKKQRYIN